MKVVAFILPVVGVLAGIAWLVTQEQSISSLDRETAALEKQVAAVGQQIPKAEGTTPVISRAAAKPVFDWKKVLSQQIESSQGGGDFRERIELEKKLNVMSRDEIVAALDEITTLDLPAGSRKLLENLFLHPLAARDPALALDRFCARAEEDSQVAVSLAFVLGRWAGEDREKAVAWIDRAIADGKFETKNLQEASQMRIGLESEMMKLLFPAAPDAMERRIVAMSETEALAVLRKYNADDMDKEHFAGFARLVRAGLTEPKRLEVLSDRAGRLAGNYADVSGYLTLIAATPAERNACVEAVAEQRMHLASRTSTVTVEKIDEMREWAATAGAADVDAMTGRVLGEVISDEGMGFDEAASLVMRYREQSGDDAALVAFLRSRARFRGDARAMAENIRDPETRADILKHIP